MWKKALRNSYSQKHNNYAKPIGRITNQFFRSQLLVFCNLRSGVIFLFCAFLLLWLEREKNNA